jgi:hypothetical protein
VQAEEVRDHILIAVAVQAEEVRDHILIAVEDVTPAKAGVQEPGEKTGFPLPRE